MKTEILLPIVTLIGVIVGFFANVLYHRIKDYFEDQKFWKEFEEKVQKQNKEFWNHRKKDFLNVLESYQRSHPEDQSFQRLDINDIRKRNNLE